jgi:hypothetical protein
MTILTDQELSYLCKYLSTASYIYYPVATNFFYDLYTTGCRPEELLEIERWSYIDVNIIQLLPLKGNAARGFNPDQLSSSMLFAIPNQVAPYEGLTLRQLTSVLYKIIPVLAIQTINKMAITYMFRYNRVRLLFAAGKTSVEVQSIFGWSSEAYGLLYNTKTLYKNSDLPIFIYPLIIDSNEDYITDADGTLLVY